MKSPATAPMIFMALMYAIIFFTVDACRHKHQCNVDLPEEINQAKPNDTLIVEQVSNDFIRIGFKHK